MKFGKLFALVLLQGLGLVVTDKSPNKESSLREMRKLLLTKDNILEHMTRQQKKLQAIQVPRPMTISTEIGFNQHERQAKSKTFQVPNVQKDLMNAEETQFVPSMGPEGGPFRSGKSFYDDNGEEEMYFDENDSLAMESLDFDVPAQQEVDNTIEENHQVHGKPYFYIGSSEKRTSLDKINQHIQETRSGQGQDNSIYYTDEEPDSLHGDRSPYNYEPADTQVQYNHLNQPSNYIIKEHVYEMCPGCPSFNLQIPSQESDYKSYAYTRQSLMNGEPLVQMQMPFVNDRPTDQLGTEEMLTPDVDDGEINNKGFFARAGEQFISTMKNFGDFFKPKKATMPPDEPPAVIEKKADTGNSFNFPLAVAGAAAVALGGLALFGTQPNVKTITGSGDLQDVYGRNGRSDPVVEYIGQAAKRFQ